MFPEVNKCALYSTNKNYKDDHYNCGDIMTKFNVSHIYQAFIDILMGMALGYTLREIISKLYQLISVWVDKNFSS